MGGLSRRAQIISEIRKQGNKPVLLLDAGNMLFEQPHFSRSLRETKKIIAAGIMAATLKMDYDAVNLAPHDLALGIDYLKDQAETKPLPWLSANLIAPDRKNGFFRPYIIKRVGDLSIGIIGLTKNMPGIGEGLPPVRVRKWSDVLPETVNEIKEKADMVILLSGYPEKTNRQIAEQIQDIHLIIESGRSRSNLPPMLAGNTLITGTGTKGKYLGRLDINWKESRQWAQNTQPMLQWARERLDRINWQLGRMERRFSNETLGRNQVYQALLEDRKRMTSELTRLEALTEKEERNSSTFSSSFIALQTSLPEDPEIKKIVAGIRTDLNEVGRKKQRMAKSSKSSGRSGIMAGMAGWRTCQGCHPAQTTFWQETQHAHARQTLINIQQDLNPECIICHVTLPTYDPDKVAGQNLLANLADDLYNVGCESCHGPARAHADNPKKIKPRPPAAGTCLTCHTLDHDNMFVFEVKKSSIACPKR